MNTAALTKLEIINQLSILPENEMGKVQIYIQSVVREAKQARRDDRSLKGIWHHKGFEKITPLEDEIRATRKHLGDTILKRVF